VQTPKKLVIGSLEEIENRIDQHCSDKYRVENSSHYECKNCGRRIEYVLAIISLHGPSLEICIGRGKVIQKTIPFCPNCEVRPESQGCVHVTMERLLDN